ncbi:MAG: PilT protein domain protein [Devosia sp.]|uniref:PIN domain-containing protein n=1 Tax=Devosia sp. TaxID=1871048 RepID=UPI00260DC496|nr:PIN domain-containing protein [Devosia sp.]MDB5538655.1 PilT protein domain protein [Devosia sp.]
MSGSFCDTNVLLYLISSDAPKAAVAEQMLFERPFISVQVLNEFANVAKRKSLRAWAEILDILQVITRTTAGVRPMTVATHNLGIELVTRHQFAIYDAMLVAAALEAECHTLYSEDMHDGLLVAGRLRIVNPFG